MPRINLPKDERDLADALDLELMPSETEANFHLTSWKIIDAYMAGIRRIRVLDRWSGNIQLGFENQLGDLHIRYEEVVRMYLTEVGRYMKMDIDPLVSRLGESLWAMRRAGIGNAALGSAIAKLPKSKIKRNMLIPFLKYGTVGISHYETGDSLHPDLLEVVHPRQLRGFPAWLDGLENLQGVARKRWVPISWLIDRVKRVHNVNLKPDDPMMTMDAMDVEWGSSPPGQTTYDGDGLVVGSGLSRIDRDDIHVNLKGGFKGRGQQNKYDTKDSQLYVPLEEVYIYSDSQEFVAQYILKAGHKIIHSENFEEKNSKVLCPLHIARHTDTGRFFARGFLSPLIPFNDQIERLLGSLFKNIMELDAFGTLFVPGQSGIDLKRWKTGPRPRAEKYEPDPINPNLQPFNLAPTNTGMMPARVAEFATNLMQRLAGQGPYYQGETSGRVDSAAGLGFLFNTGNVSLGLPSHGLADALSGVYSRILQSMKDRMGPGDVVELPAIDDAIAGVIVDPMSGRMELTQNPLPDPWEVKIDVKDRTPRESTVRKQELLELHQRGLLGQDPSGVRFWITVFEEGLDFPGAPKDIVETWRKAMYQIIILFRDGKTPGTLVMGEHTQNPQVQLLAVQQFMNKVEFSLASVEVRNAFVDWKESLERLAGNYQPAGLPPAEEAAANQQAMIQQAMAQAQGR